jgi:hypothetical protein
MEDERLAEIILLREIEIHECMKQSKLESDYAYYPDANGHGGVIAIRSSRGQIFLEKLRIGPLRGFELKPYTKGFVTTIWFGYSKPSPISKNYVLTN